MGYVKQESDINGIIASLHKQLIKAGLIASLPRLASLFFKHPFVKKHLLPQGGDQSGTGKLMTVSLDNISLDVDPVLNLSTVPR